MYRTKSLFPRREKKCGLCEEKFEPKMACFSTLIIQDEEWVRKDFCKNCWQERVEKKGNYWKRILPLPEKLTLPIEAKPLHLLRQLLDTKDIEEKKMLFLLALYCERKKSLIKTPIKEKGSANKVFYECLNTGEIFSIESFSFSKEEHESLSNKFLHLLENA